MGDLLQLALPVLMAGLQDKDDSVQAAAAEALVPLAPLLLQMHAEDVGGPARVSCLGKHIARRCQIDCSMPISLPA